MVSTIIASSVGIAHYLLTIVDTIAITFLTAKRTQVPHLTFCIEKGVAQKNRRIPACNPKQPRHFATIVDRCSKAVATRHKLPELTVAV